MVGSNEVQILVLADQLSTEAENLMNSNDNKARGVVKTVLERIVSETLYDLGTDDGKKVDHLRAMQVQKAKLDELSQTISRLKHQVYSLIMHSSLSLMPTPPPGLEKRSITY
jgi:hypothetical protein